MGGGEAAFGTDSPLFYHNPPFDLNLDSFDILSDFPDAAPHGYDGGIGETPGSGHHVGSPMHNNNNNNNSSGGGSGGGGGGGASHLGATIKTRTLEYRENLVTITDYSPSWPYTDVSISISFCFVNI